MSFDAIPLILFASCVVTIFSFFCVIVLRAAYKAIWKKQAPNFSFVDRTVIALGLIGVACVLYGWLIEPYWLSVERVELKSSKVKVGERIKVVHISDLHCDPVIRLEDKLPGVIASEKPDAIVFTGDAINSPEGLGNFRRCLINLARLAPTFVVKGNWDAWYFKDQDRFGGTGATELTDTPAILKLKGCEVCIGGLPVGTKSSVEKVMAGVSESDYRIFLFHYPDFIEEMQKNNIDLYLAGHTHGGQVALPIYGALVTLSAKGKEFESGLHLRGQTYEYTNRGIGMEGGPAPRVRFCARPEITVFTIVSSDSAVDK